MEAQPDIWFSWWGGSDWVVRSVFVILGILSVASWSVILYKTIQFTSLLRRERCVPSRRLAGELRSLDQERAALQAWVDISLREARLNLETGLTLLATIGNTAPFIGLLGTVWGIMHALQTLGGDKALSMDMVAGPVAEALVATAVGLFAAIPAVVGYNLLLRQLRRIAGVMEGNAARLVESTLKGGR